MMAAPGTMGSFAGTDAYESFGDCVAANRALPPLDFELTTPTKLGLLAADIDATDSVGGESAGGIAPTWRLNRLEPCP